MLTGNRKKQTTETCNNMDSSKMPSTKWKKKKDSNGYIVCDFVYMIIWKRWNYWDREQ